MKHIPHNAYVSLPRRNIWQILFDVRPKRLCMISDPWTLFPRIIDLKIVRRDLQKTQVPIGKPLQRTRIYFDWGGLARGIIVVSAILLAVSGLFWSVTWSQAFVTSKKSDILSIGETAARNASAGLEAFRAMRFTNAAAAFEDAAAKLEELRYSFGPAFSIVSFSAHILPNNDYAKTALMLDEVKNAFLESAKLANLAAKAFSAAPDSLFGASPELISSLTEAENILAKLTNSINAIGDYRNSFADKIASAWFEKLPQQKLELQEARSILAAIRELLGTDRPRTILLLFQNPAEIRPTGGFVGSYGILRLERGKIAEFLVDDIYNPDGQLRIKVLPPRPLRRITPVWGARDANWFFDFPLSAKKVAQFLEATTGRHFDTVIALNPIVVSELIDLVGPIDMPEYETTVTGSNFWEWAQYQTRAGEDRQKGEPKKFLTILGPRLLDKFRGISSAELMSLQGIFDRGFADKDIMMWSEDPVIEKIMKEREWDGGIKKNDSNQDYLAVALSNIGGGKADYVTTQKYDLQTEVQPNGDIINTLKITRAHNGQNAKYSWWRAQNVDYIKVYVPLGATLQNVTGASPEPRLIDIGKDKSDYTLDADAASTIEAALRLPDQDVDIFEESGKTVFGMWQVLNPGATRSITLKYILPFKTGYSPPVYSFISQKQSGVKAYFSHSITLPENSRVISASDNANPMNAADLGEKFSWASTELPKELNQIVTFEFRSAP